MTNDVLAATLDEICQLDAPLWRRLEFFVAKQREWKTPFAAAGERLVERLKIGDFGHSAPQIGETMPGFVLPDQDGRMRSLDELVSGGPLVMSLNRGHWCPFCRIELAALADAHRDFRRTRREDRFDHAGSAAIRRTPPSRYPTKIDHPVGHRQ